MQILGQTPIKVFDKDKDKEVSNGYTLGHFKYREDDSRTIWGLFYAGSPTQMSYGSDYAKIKDSVIKKRSKYNDDPDHDPDWLRWYFDVGNKLYVTLDDLEEAAKELEIW